jgi:Uma2 family endonuclease
MSSRERDLRIKPRLYAAASPEYWVLDLEAGRIIVHRHPDDNGYREVNLHGPDALLQAEQLALPPLPVAELLAAL